MKKTRDNLIEFYKHSSFTFGAGDIFCFGSANTNERLGDLISVLSGMRDKHGRFPISRIVIVLPPQIKELLGNDESIISEAISQAPLRLRGRAITKEESEILKELIRVVHSSNLEIKSALSLLQAAEHNSVMIFLYAARYRDDSVVPPRLRHGSAGALPEDVWSTYVQRFANGAAALSKQVQSYVLLDTGEEYPYRTENIDLLSSIEVWSLAGSHPTNDASKIIADKADEWVEGIKRGHVGSVFSSIDSLPEWMNDQKGILKIQVLHRAAPQAQMQLLEMIRTELKGREDIDPEMRVKLARLTEDAGDSELASELLAPAISQLNSQESLESALLIARDIGNSMFEQECLKHLETSFPGSHQLQRRRLSNLIYGQKYEEALVMLENEIGGYCSEDRAFYKELISRLRGPLEPDYQTLSAEMASKWPPLAAQVYFVCIEDARARGLRHAALGLAASIELTGNVAQRAAETLIRAVKEILLQRTDNGELTVKPAALREPVLKLIRYLSQHPSDGATRAALAQLLSIPVTGTFGLPIITSVALDLAHETALIEKQPSRDSSPVFDTHDFEVFFKDALEWMKKESPILPGQSVLPVELLTARADLLMREITHLVEDSGNRLASKEEVAFFENILFLGLVVAPHVSDQGDDLILLRLAIGKLILAGRVQRARDLAEQMLHIAGAQPFRARLAWYGFADVYHRLHNLTEAFIGLSCALTCEVAIPGQQAFYETNLFIRLLRDLGLLDMAKSLLPRCQALLERLELGKEYSHRLVTIELGIEAMELSRNPDGRSSEIRTLVKRAEENCRVVLEQNDELAPTAGLLGQSIYLSRLLNIAVEESVFKTLETALTKLGEPACSLIRTLTALVPSALDVLNLANGLETARYAEDAGFDLHYVVMAAKRLLESEEAARNSSVAAFAIELLADQAIEPPAIPQQPTELSKLLSSVEAPATYVKELSRLGIDIHLLALGSSGRLIRLAAVDGILGEVVREETTVFSKERFEEWSKEFPYKYGSISEIYNGFYISMNGIEFTIVPSRRVLVISDTLLQQLPANLLLTSENFIGRNFPIAAAPSISWLRAVRESKRKGGKHRVAWISTATKNSENSTLMMVADRIKPTLEAHGVQLLTTTEIPTELRDSDIAVIAAHGGITPWGNFFQVVADEDNLRLTTSAVSAAMRNVRIAILFVCSGGRLDKHPTASTTVGLTKQLLENGCSAVIASPWPLDARVPSHWLPRFFEVWEAGYAVVDANFEANQAVAKAMGDSPAYCLAMSVFGDPLTVKS